MEIKLWSEVGNGFRFYPLAVEKKLKMTAPVWKSGGRGLFRKFPVKTV